MPAKVTSAGEICESLLKLLFNGTAWPNVADNAASSPLTNLYVSLHTADPGATGDQTTSECAYTGYARVAVARTTGGFTVSGATVTLAGTVTFPTCTGGSETATHWAVGTAASGAGHRWHKGTITPNIVIASGTTPKLVSPTGLTES